VSFAAISVTNSRVVHNSQMAIVEPIDLRVINIAWARVPEYADVFTASIALKRDFGNIASQKPGLID
jgi:hypothetical protein